MKFLDNIINKILNESIDSKAKEITKKINEKISMDEDVDPFDLEVGEEYDYKKSEDDDTKTYIFTRRGGHKGPFHFKNKLGKDLMFGTKQVEKMKKKETKENQLKGKQYKIDKNKNGKIDSEDFKLLRKGNKSEIDEKLYGNQTKLDKNKNGKIDSEDFKMLRKSKKVSEMTNEERNTKFKSTFGKFNLKEGSLKEYCGGKITKNCISEALNSNNPKLIEKATFAKNLNNIQNESVIYKIQTDNNDYVILDENEMITMIEKMVNEQQAKSKGMTSYDTIHKKDKQINKQGSEESLLKIAKYVKQGSEGNFEANPKGFPKGNGELKKMDKKAYVPSEYVKDYVDAFAYPGQTNLVFDEIKPDDEWIEMNLKGSSKTGNAQVDKDGNALGNVVPSETGDKFYKNYEDNLYGAEQLEASYKRQNQPVEIAGEKTKSGKLSKSKAKANNILNKLDESVEKYSVINEEMENMKKLFTYNQKTQ